MNAELEAEAQRYLDEMWSDPYPFYARLRAAAPVTRASGGQWLVSRYAEAQAVLKSSETFSRAQATEMVAERVLEPGYAPEIMKAMIVATEGDRHRRQRGLLTKAFTPLAIERWRATIEETVATLLDDVADAGQMDLVADFAYPLPERIICTMLGVPQEDHKLFEAWSRAFIPPPNEAPSEDTRTKATDALLNFVGYLEEKVADRRRDLKDDLMSLLIKVADEGERLSETELLANLFELTVAGHETTANLIGNGVYNLLRHPDELHLLQADPALAAAAVEEVLRFDTPAPHTNVRATTRDCEVGGVAIPANQLVTVVVASANRDDREFEEADSFRLTRSDNRHLGFGWGDHFCLGATLSRVEGQVAFARLFERLPTLELASDELTWRKGERIHSLEALPVAW